jgi:Mn-containing catalase
VTWTAAYIVTIGEPTAHLRSNIAAEAHVTIVYGRLINVTDDPGDGFLTAAALRYRDQASVDLRSDDH